MLSANATKKFYQSPYFDFALALVLVLGSLALRLYVLVEFESVDRLQKDGYCRVVGIKFWMELGDLLPKSVWLPFSFFVTRFFYIFINDLYQAGVSASLFFGVWSCALFFLWGRSLVGRWPAFLLAVFLSLLWPNIETSTHPMQEPIYLCLVLWALLFLQAEKYLFFGLLLSLACWTRMEAVVSVGCASLFLGYHAWKLKSYRNFFSFLKGAVWGPLLVIGYYWNQKALFLFFDANSSLAKAEKEFEPKSLWQQVDMFSADTTFVVLICGLSGLFLGLFAEKKSTRLSALIFFGPAILKIYSMMVQDVPAEPRYLIVPISLGLYFLGHWMVRTVGMAAVVVLILVLSFPALEVSQKTFYSNLRRPIAHEEHQLVQFLSELPQGVRTVFDVGNYDECRIVLRSGLEATKYLAFPSWHFKYLRSVRVDDDEQLEKYLSKASAEYVVLRNRKSELSEALLRYRDSPKSKLRIMTIYNDEEFSVFKLKKIVGEI